MKEKDYCGCCLSEDCYKDMTNAYFFGGTSEVYSTMLIETFDINLSQHGIGRCLICDGCIIRLRDAASFKRQVLATQKNVLKATLMDTNVVVTRMDFKTEDDDDFDDRVSVFSDSDFTWESGTKDTDGQIFVIKIEDKNENSTFTTNKTCGETNSDDHIHCDDTMIMTRTKTRDECNNPKNTSTNDKVKENSMFTTNKTCGGTRTNTRDKRNIANDTSTNDKAKSNTQKTSKEELPKVREVNDRRKKNTLKLLQNSNVCLFRSLRNKYGCYACKETFLDIAALREHISTHANTKYLSSTINHLRGLSYRNVDISDLKCNRCNGTCTDLVDLKNHLTTKHKIDFVNDDHFLIPFRLKDELRCVLCAHKFKTFIRLLIHMNTHYTNNVCDVCGLSFINRMSLRMHQNIKHTERKCNLCAAILLSVAARNTHMRRVHNISKKHKRYCHLCDKTFRYTYMLEEHKIKEHDYERPPILHCPECSKSFSSEVNLRTHMRAVHIKERNHPCDACGMRFFTKCDRVRHERTHQDVRSFSCAYCDVKFKCNDSCRRHMKRQHGHVF